MDLDREETMRFAFCRHIREPLGADSLIFHDDIHQSKDEEPPVYPSADSTPANCRLESDLSDVDISMFTRSTGADGHPNIEVEVDLVATIKEAIMRGFT